MRKHADVNCSRAPGLWYLKHIGFLGATAPAVPGLKPVRFAGASGGIELYQENPASAEFAASDELVRLRREAREYEVEKLISDGRVLPAFKDEVIAFAASLDDSQTVSFAEGAEAVSRRNWFMSYLARQPQAVSFGEFSMDAPPRHARRQTSHIPEGYQADRQNDDLFFAAQAVARDKGISFADAVDLVIEGRA